MTLARQIPWHKASKLDLRSIFRGGVDGAIYQPADPAVLLTRRNLLTYTEAFDNAAWIRTNILSVTDNADGVGDLVIPNATPGVHALATVAIAVVVGIPCVITVRAKAGGYDWLAYSTGTTFGYANVNTGAVGTQSGATCNVTAAADAPGYFDVVFRFTPISTASVTLYVAPTDMGAGPFAGDGVSGIYFARVQLDRGTTTPSEYQGITDWTTEYLADSRHDRIVQWQESTGVTPVTVTETACGLRLDERFTGIRGAELSTYSAGFPNTTGITTTASTVALVGSALEVTGTSGAGNNYAVVPMASGLTVGRTYEVRMRVRRGAQGVQQGVNVFTFATITARAVTNSGTFTEISWRVVATATSGTGRVYASDAAGAIGDSVLVESISVREVPGNHTLQATSAARPVVSQRYNLANSSQAAAGTGLTVAAVGTSYDGFPTQRVTKSDATTPRYLAQAHTMTAHPNTGYVVRRRFKYDGFDTTVSLEYNATTDFNLSWGAVFTVNASGVTLFSQVNCVATVLPIDSDGYYPVRVTFTSGAAPSTPTNPSALTRVTGASGVQVLTSAYDLRTADDAAKSIPAYQYVNTATDYDTDGFPAYEKFDGVDDSRVSATGGGSTTGFFWCGVVTVLGGSGNRALFDDRVSSNNGTLVYVDSGGKLALNVGASGSAVEALTAATLPVGTTRIVTCWHDGVNAYAQLDNLTVAVSATIGVSSGGAAFTMGKFNYAASSYFNGRIYNAVYAKNYCPSANLRERVKRELARRAGCLHLLA